MSMKSNKSKKQLITAIILFIFSICILATISVVDISRSKYIYKVELELTKSFGLKDTSSRVISNIPGGSIPIEMNSITKVFNFFKDLKGVNPDGVSNVSNKYLAILDTFRYHSKPFLSNSYLSILYEIDNCVLGDSEVDSLNKVVEYKKNVLISYSIIVVLSYLFFLGSSISVINKLIAYEVKK